MSTRRSTRRTAGKAAAAAAQLESEFLAQPQSTMTTTMTTTTSTTKASTRSRATSASTTTAAACRVTKRNTRAAKAAGNGSPLRALQSPERKRKRAAPGQTASVTPEPTPSGPAQTDNTNVDDDDMDDDDQEGIFFSKKFDTQLQNFPATGPAQPMFVSGNESARALLTKLENAAKEPREGQSSVPVTEDVSSPPDPDVNMESTPQHASTKRTREEAATPERARPFSPSSLIRRSVSAVKSIGRLFSAITLETPPQNPSPPQVAPPPSILTETLSTPPTPVGASKKTPAKKKTNHLMRTLLKGTDPTDTRKAEDWAKQIIPSLKNDPAFRQKRKRLETPVLVRNINNFPSAKPWEAGFGDPLADLDDDDVAPVWAVYLDMVAEEAEEAEEEERTAKKHKTAHGASVNHEEVSTITEHHAASNSQSASNHDLQPRRSIEPSPMFNTSLSHHQGENVFKELRGHHSAAEIRTTDREVLQSATNAAIQPHSPGMGSFSVPDDSDEEDSVLNDNVGLPAAPVWTQAPPPAPVPAHAPLPGGAPADASSTTITEKHVDEVERQRQKLMKFTPAKPSRLREATFPSPSLLSDAGNESILMTTPAHTAAVNSIFNGMPGAEVIYLEPSDQAALANILTSDTYKDQFLGLLQPPIISYDSDEEDLSPV
ncbi:hypothetical protein IAQ61_003045 [Plenodomus lingam]|uniref:uncharacterized protein n=1 Tax=Leptosphaeria maculans TaxID=5022 RepID=UPI003329C7A1|nr:hypothetical protein IAQ61_003045 [Plenodomus lingam]